MTSATKRTLGILLAVVLAIGVLVLIVWGRFFPDGSSPVFPGGNLTKVTGVIGSEKKPFFEDPEVKAVFAKHGYDVSISTAGSRQIATSVDLSAIDFVFPSSAPAAEKIKREKGAKTVYYPFFSPIVVASFEPIAELLEGAGVTSKQANGSWEFDLEAYLDLVSKGTRWNELPGAKEKYNSSRSILISSTDVRSSNSAAMYLSLASYVANGNRIVSSSQEEAAIIDQLAALFLDQGFSGSSSEAPFEEYLSLGIGSKPLVTIYEAQYYGRLLGEETKNSITADMVLLAPQPTVLSRHAVVPLSEAGDAVGALLQNDPELQRLAARYGFRPVDPTVFQQVLSENQIEVPALPVNVVEPPSYETLESLIVRISEKYQSAANQ